MPMMPSPVAGLTYGAMFNSVAPDDTSDVLMDIGTLPVRLLVWAAVIQMFYRDGLQRRTMVRATLAGTAWSYALDGLMVLLFGILPGMEMPFC